MRARQSGKRQAKTKSGDRDGDQHGRVARPGQPPCDKSRMVEQRALPRDEAPGSPCVATDFPARRTRPKQRARARSSNATANRRLTLLAAREEILLRCLRVLPSRGAIDLELAEPDDDLARLRSLVLTDDFELFELLHQAHGARMADREPRLQRGRRRVVRLDDELRRLVAERIGFVSRALRRRRPARPRRRAGCPGAPGAPRTRRAG